MLLNGDSVISSELLKTKCKSNPKFPYMPYSTVLKLKNNIFIQISYIHTYIHFEIVTYICINSRDTSAEKKWQETRKEQSTITTTALSSRLYIYEG